MFSRGPFLLLLSYRLSRFAVAAVRERERSARAKKKQQGNEPAAAAAAAVVFPFDIY